MNEPRVIADEPMDEDEESETQNKRVETSRDSRMDSGSRPADVFSRLLQPAKPRVAQSSFVESISVSSNHGSLLNPGASNGFEDDYNWKCTSNKENAHNAQICGVATYGNQLYSTSNKSLKIWDLESMKLLSDLHPH